MEQNLAFKPFIYSLAPNWLGSRFDSFKFDSSTIPVPVSSAISSSFNLPFTGLQSFSKPILAAPGSPKKDEADEI